MNLWYPNSLKQSIGFTEAVNWIHWGSEVNPLKQWTEFIEAMDWIHRISRFNSMETWIYSAILEKLLYFTIHAVLSDSLLQVIKFTVSRNLLHSPIEFNSLFQWVQFIVSMSFIHCFSELDSLLLWQIISNLVNPFPEWLLILLVGCPAKYK